MSSLIPKVVIVKAIRTAIGSFGGSLRELEASQLGTTLIEHILKTSNLETDLISEIIMGQVYTAGCGLNPARIASVKAGLPYSVPATTVNQVCGSGMKAIIAVASLSSAKSLSCAQVSSDSLTLTRA